MTDDLDSIEDNLQSIREHLDSMERTWRWYGLPAIIIAWFVIGLLIGLFLGAYVP